MTIINYSPTLRKDFEEMLVEYFCTDLQSDIPQDIVRSKLVGHILNYVQNHIIHLALAVEEENLIGFSIYQIDTAESDWCKRPGWGFIREFYIRRPYRGRGNGKQLASYTEQHLRNMGASQLYLTSDNAIGFWANCGWCNTHEQCSNDLEILTK